MKLPKVSLESNPIQKIRKPRKCYIPQGIKPEKEIKFSEAFGSVYGHSEIIVRVAKPHLPKLTGKNYYIFIVTFAMADEDGKFRSDIPAASKYFARPASEKPESFLELLLEKLNEASIEKIKKADKAFKRIDDLLSMKTALFHSLNSISLASFRLDNDLLDNSLTEVESKWPPKN